MIINIEALDEAYKTMRQDAMSQGCTIIIFVSPETDSLCACKILTTILQADSIPYKVKPVSGYEDLEAAYQTIITGNEELRSLVLLNCGGGTDLKALFRDLPETVGVYVVDSHRPYHLSNVRATNNQVRLLHDAEDAKEEYPSDLDEEDAESEGGESDEEGDRKKRRRTGLQTFEQVQKRKEKRARINEYYRGTYYGKAASGIIYDLASQLAYKDSDFVWMGIVGTTDLLLQERISYETYLKHAAFYVDEVARVTAAPTSTEETKESKLAHDELVTRVKEKHISSTREYRFMLVRHWSLYESMYHSQYIASRLGIWLDNGRQKLQRIFAKMGLPLDECKAKFAFMRDTFKEQLRTKVDEIAQTYKLGELTYHSFARQHGLNMQISASDMAYATSALLEEPSEPKTGEAAWTNNFWIAYDSLSSTKLDLLKQGLKCSIKLQKAIVRQGIMMLKKKSFVSSGQFRYAFIEESPDLHFFAHPLALNKLALFLMEIFLQQTREKTKQQGKGAKPLVLCTFVESRNSYLIVGVMNHVADNKNLFGRAFEECTSKCNARTKYQGFGTSIVECQKEDVQRFMEYLHSGMIKL